MLANFLSLTAFEIISCVFFLYLVTSFLFFFFFFLINFRTFQCTSFLGHTYSWINPSHQFHNKVQLRKIQHKRVLKTGFYMFSVNTGSYGTHLHCDLYVNNLIKMKVHTDGLDTGSANSVLLLQKANRVFVKKRSHGMSAWLDVSGLCSPDISLHEPWANENLASKQNKQNAKKKYHVHGTHFV